MSQSSPMIASNGDSPLPAGEVMRQVRRLSEPAQRAYKDIVRFIHGRNHGPGDRLPSQDVLRRALATSNHALTPALRLMTDLGALERRTKAGTVLWALDPLKHVPWNIGIATLLAPDVGPNSYFAMLTHMLQGHIARSGWRSRTYYWFEGRQHTKPTLNEFAGLTEDIASRELDGVVLLTMLRRGEWAELESRGVPLCHASFWDEAPCAVVVDQAEMTQRAVGMLVERGCRRLALLGSPLRTSSAFRAGEGLLRGLSRAGLSSSAGTVIEVGASIAAGHEAAARITALPAQARPQGLIVLDDFTAAGLSEALVARVPDANETFQMAVIASRQSPLSYPLPVFRFDVDVDALSHRVLSLLGQRLVNPDCPSRVDWFACGQPSPVAARTIECMTAS